jgi:Mg/Co/Ni transporter MgtE
MMSNIEDFAQNYIEQHPDQAMTMFDHLNINDAVEYLVELEVDKLLNVASFISIPIAKQLLAHSKKDVITALIRKIPTRLLVRWVWFVGSHDRAGILELLKPEQRKVVQSLLAASKNVAGAVADISIPPVTIGTDIRTCLQNIFSTESYGSNYIYIVNHDGKLLGVSSLRKLFLAMDNKDMNIESIMNGKVSTVFFQTCIHDLIKDPMWKSYDVLPVVDSSGGYLGAISHRQVRALDSFGALSKKEVISSDIGELYNAGMFSLLEGVCSMIESDKREVEGDE